MHGSLLRKRLLPLLAIVLGGLALPGQTDDTRFDQGQADRLNKFAKSAFDKGFYGQAKLIWLMAIKLYSPDDKTAHNAIGEVKQGAIWVPDSSKPYPHPDTGKARDGMALAKRYESLKKALANAHKQRAQTWAKASRTDKVRHHYEMVLRWDKSDRQAQAALEHKPVGQLTGTSLEQTLYERSLMIQDTIKTQAKQDYPVQVVEGSTHPVLERAKMKYQTVKSEHFTLRGDHELKILKQALVFAEQALRVVQAAFPKGKGFNEDPANWVTDWGYFIEKDSYEQLLRANADQVPDLEWRIKESSTCQLGTIAVGATGSERVLYDAVVRNVAQNYAGFRSTGLREGIGHTFVGQFFNNNHLFAVDRKKQEHTVSSEEDRMYTRPDFDLWKDLALDMAWRRTGQVKAAQLPLCKAHDFTNEQRIKAWSFCDYVMRRDPTILQTMDQLAGERNPYDVEARFQKARGDVGPLQTLDKGWEDFWTGASPVLRNIRAKQPPLAGVSKDVSKWLSAINAIRKKYGQAPVTWSANYSVRCREHAEYLKANRSERGPAKEHQQDPQLPGSSHLGSMFAQMAIVDTKASAGRAEKTIESWVDIPGYRDLIMNQFVQSVGIYSTGKILVINAVSGLGKPKSGKVFFTIYPKRKGATTTGNVVPGAVKVKDLGPEVQALLEQHGHGKLKTVGQPITLHFGMGIQGKRTSYRCAVGNGDDAVETLILWDGGKIRRTTAPGMVTAYPLKPLKGQVSARWTWEQTNGEQSLAVEFTAR